MINSITNTYNDNRNKRWHDAWLNLVAKKPIYEDLLLVSKEEKPTLYSLTIVINPALLTMSKLEQVKLNNGCTDVLTGEQHALFSEAVGFILKDWYSHVKEEWHIIDVDTAEYFSLAEIFSDAVHLADTFKSKLSSDFLNQQSISRPDTESDRLSDVLVLRYLLCPKMDKLSLFDSQLSDSQQPEGIKQSLIEALTDNLVNIDEEKVSFDCHLLPLSKVITVPKMACFDMDSTLIEEEVIVEIANATGIGKKVNEITELAMRGEIDFNESFAKRVALLDGTDARVLDGINDSLTLSAGAMTTLYTLNALGCYTVLLSGGFTYFAKVVADKLSIDEYHANVLKVTGGSVVGEAQLPIVDGKRKAELVKKIANEQGIKLSDVVCVGDGANDLNMMSIANLGIAYRAKPIVQKQADTAVNCTGLEGVLHVLGL